MATPDDLRDYAAHLESKDVDRVVIRWIDEVRPVEATEEEGGEGFTVKEVVRVTLKAGIDGEMVEKTFEGLKYRQARSILAEYDFETLYRTDNVT